MKQNFKLALIGYGVMGKAYYRALETVFAHLSDKHDITIELCAIIDRSPDALNEAAQHDTACYADYETAFAETRPDFIINAIHDDQHFDLFKALEKYPFIKGALSEKPFTENLDEATALKSTFEARGLSLNLIENFSEAVPVFEKDIKGAFLDGFDLIGVEGVWGKDRRADTRPTTGVISDMVHPTGLFMRIFDVDGFQIKGGKTVSGPLMKNCSIEEKKTKAVEFEHETHILSAQDIPICLESSYGWQTSTNEASPNARDRRVIGHFKKGDVVRSVEFCFDDPENGHDHIYLYETTSESDAPRLIEHREVFNKYLDDRPIDPNDFNKGGKAKLYRFIYDSLNRFIHTIDSDQSADIHHHDARVIGYERALENQTLLETMEENRPASFVEIKADPHEPISEQNNYSATPKTKRLSNISRLDLEARLEKLSKLKAQPRQPRAVPKTGLR